METISGWAQNISYQVSDGAVEQREFISALHDGHSGGDAHHHDDFCIHGHIQSGESFYSQLIFCVHFVQS